MKHRLKYWGLALIGGIVIVSTLAVLVGHWANKSATGTVHVGTTAKQTTSPAQALSLTTTYFTTKLPTGFRLQQRTETPQNAITQLHIVALSSTDLDQQFAVTMGTVPTGGLKELGDYNLRATQLSSYAPFLPIGMPSDAIAFRSITGPAGFSVFWQHGSQYAEIALSSDGGATLDQLQATYTTSLTSWHWLH